MPLAGDGDHRQLRRVGRRYGDAQVVAHEREIACDRIHCVDQELRIPERFISVAATLDLRPRQLVPARDISRPSLNSLTMHAGIRAHALDHAEACAMTISESRPLASRLLAGNEVEHN